jgi:hypothetical protein
VAAVIQLLTIKLDDEKAERVRRNTQEALAELQRTPAARAGIVRDVTLADGIATPVPHGLGRPAFATPSPPRGAVSTGRIEEVRDGTHDRTKYVVLKATGWGATITLDVEVKPL